MWAIVLLLVVEKVEGAFPGPGLQESPVISLKNLRVGGEGGGGEGGPVFLTLSG